MCVFATITVTVVTYNSKSEMSLMRIQSQILTKSGLLLKLYTRNAATDAEKIRSMKDLSAKLAKILGVESGYVPNLPDRSHLEKYIPKSQDELPPRSMADSFLIGLIPLSTDLELQNKYTTYLGHVRNGRLLEDMDLFAVMVAQKHFYNPKLPKDVPAPHTLVTALVDRINYTDYSTKVSDIKLLGHVGWVGTSSIEVIVWLEQNENNTWHRITRAVFTMVVRNSTNTKSAPINRLLPANDMEKKIFESGASRKRHRVILITKHVSKVLPTQEEQDIIHKLYMKTKQGSHDLPPNHVWMGEWTLTNVVFSHPEHRNLHNTVFGGFIMRKAIELSWILGYRFCKIRPKVYRISDINFKKPIHVNALMEMMAYVAYTEDKMFQIIVLVKVYDAPSGTSDVVDTFRFTYKVEGNVPKIVPRTYHEAMTYIDGRRNFLTVVSPADPSLKIKTLSEKDIKGKTELTL